MTDLAAPQVMVPRSSVPKNPRLWSNGRPRSRAAGQSALIGVARHWAPPVGASRLDPGTHFGWPSEPHPTLKPTSRGTAVGVARFPNGINRARSFPGQRSICACRPPRRPFVQRHGPYLASEPSLLVRAKNGASSIERQSGRRLTHNPHSPGMPQHLAVAVFEVKTLATIVEALELHPGDGFR